MLGPTQIQYLSRGSFSRRHKCGTAFLDPRALLKNLMTTKEMTMTIIMDYKLKLSKSSELAHTRPQYNSAALCFDCCPTAAMPPSL